MKDFVLFVEMGGMWMLVLKPVKKEVYHDGREVAWSLRKVFIKHKWKFIIIILVVFQSNYVLYSGIGIFFLFVDIRDEFINHFWVYKTGPVSSPWNLNTINNIDSIEENGLSSIRSLEFGLCRSQDRKWQGKNNSMTRAKGHMLLYSWLTCWLLSLP